MWFLVVCDIAASTVVAVDSQLRFLEILFCSIFYEDLLYAYFPTTANKVLFSAVNYMYKIPFSFGFEVQSMCENMNLWTLFGVFFDNDEF